MADDHDRTCKKSSNTTRSGVKKLFETFAFAACFSNIGTFMNLPPLLTSAFLVQRDLVFHSGLPQLGLFPVVNFNSAMRFEASYLEICASPSCVVRITCCEKGNIYVSTYLKCYLSISFPSPTSRSSASSDAGVDLSPIPSHLCPNAWSEKAVAGHNFPRRRRFFYRLRSEFTSRTSTDFHERLLATPTPKLPLCTLTTDTKLPNPPSSSVALDHSKW